MEQDQLPPLETFAQHVRMVRGQKVLLDADLAALYGVETKRLKEQVRRNRERFPEDFIFELTAEEVVNLRSQIATSSWGGTRYLPMAFTEHGAIMAATILSSPRAVQIAVYVVRAFVQLREMAVTHHELARRLDALEEKTERLAMQHDAFSRNTRLQLRQLFDALREMTGPPASAAKQPIGFVPLQDKPSRSRAKTSKATSDRRL